MKTTAPIRVMKPPPPVPPRPSKSVVAEALAKSRRQNTSVANPVITLSSQCDRSAQNYHRTVVFQSPKATKSATPPIDDQNHVNTLIDVMFASVLDTAAAAATPPTSTLPIDNNSNMADKVSEEFESALEVSASVVEAQNRPLKDSSSTSVTVITASNSNDSGNESTAASPTATTSKSSSQTSTGQRRKNSSPLLIMDQCHRFDDALNHELLIAELEGLRLQERNTSNARGHCGVDEQNQAALPPVKIHHSDWVEVNHNGDPVRLSSCQILITDQDQNELHSSSVSCSSHSSSGDNNSSSTDFDCSQQKWSTNIDSSPPINKIDYERIKKMSSLNGLPPLPKSLSGYNNIIADTAATIRAVSQVSPPYRSTINVTQTHNSGVHLDSLLAILRQEMCSLRQLDLSLLSQLWSLNESIQDFRQILQEHEDRVLSPPSPSPAPSSDEDETIDESSATIGNEEFYPLPATITTASTLHSHRVTSTHPMPPPPPLPVRRVLNGSHQSSKSSTPTKNLH